MSSFNYYSAALEYYLPYNPFGRVVKESIHHIRSTLHFSEVDVLRIAKKLIVELLMANDRPFDRLPIPFILPY